MTNGEMEQRNGTKQILCKLLNPRVPPCTRDCATFLYNQLEPTMRTTCNTLCWADLTDNMAEFIFKRVSA
eukprot:905704-Amphidinium_carterae.2